MLSSVLFAAANLKAMATESASTAPAPVMGVQRRWLMSKAMAIIHYHAAMAVFRTWLDRDVISRDELNKIEAIIAQKYGLSPHTIYRINA